MTSGRISNRQLRLGQSDGSLNITLVDEGYTTSIDGEDICRVRPSASVAGLLTLLMGTSRKLEIFCEHRLTCATPRFHPNHEDSVT
jgi:hypothetical protein